MEVASLSSQGPERDPRLSSPPPSSPEDATGPAPPMLFHNPKHSIDSGIAFPPPTPITPPPKPIELAESIAEHAEPRETFEHVHRDDPHEDDDHRDSEVEASPSGSRAIPPPPNPRRHRSGVLMSRVRANSGGASFKSGLSMTSSKSFGDLSVSHGSGFMMSSMDPGDEEQCEGNCEAGTRDWDFRRVFSDPSRKPGEEDDAMWDNSARFYHHLHSRPASRPPSRGPSHPPSPRGSPHAPSSSSPTPSQSAPIHVRRSINLPQNGLGPPPPGAGLSASLSPNHHFLQQHLPPAFPFAASVASSPESTLSAPPHSMVILTPTTAEWKELIGESGSTTMEEGGSGSSEASEDGRRSLEGRDEREVNESTLQLRIQEPTPKPETVRPPLKRSVSADFLAEEAMHTPDPGSPVLSATDIDQRDTQEQRSFQPNIIAPSPILPTYTRSAVLEGSAFVRGSSSVLPYHGAESEAVDTILTNDGPVRFASIGRRESLRAIKKPGEEERGPKAKTKRELERERLFRDLDEELEADRETRTPLGGPSYIVQEIGKGGGLSSRPSSADSMRDERPNSREELSVGAGIGLQIKLTESNPPLPISTKPVQISPTLPLKPSPLHASPLNAASNLPTPSDESPGVDDGSQAQHADGVGRSRSPSAQAANLGTIRDFARLFVNPHHHENRPGAEDFKSPPKPPSPHSTRLRDTSRVSLVAGRVVQPFTIPPSTALPPQTAERPTLTKKTSFTSFSPFRSPSLAPSRAAPTPPPFGRLDSTFSIAPSTGAPSEVGTPTDEATGGVGGRGIEDYVILREAGKGAYGLVMRAKVKGPKGEPVGDEVIIKYIVKARILADCWKKHKVLGPIPVEIHVMDQIRHLMYHSPRTPHPWDPSRLRSNGKETSPTPLATPAVETATPTKLDTTTSVINGAGGLGTPDSLRSSPRSVSSASMLPATQKYLDAEMRIAPGRGHPNICQLLDFFEDREFYYMVMPRFGTGLDLFDRVEACPNGLDPFEIRSLIGQLADAVRFLHANGIVHRDLKDENVILDGSGRCQLIDFGSAAHWRPGKRWDTFSGTLHYASPEILRGEMYGGKEQDIYALGTVMYVLLVGETPFSDLPDEVLHGLHPGSSAVAALKARCGGEHADDGLERDGGGRLEDAADLVRRCLEMEAGDRPTGEQVCQHRFLRGEQGWVGRKGWQGVKAS